MTSKNPIELFWAKVNKNAPNGCWEWTASLRNGYGQFSFFGKPVKAHRLSMQFAGHDLKDLHVLHKCDNPLCVNPDHLFLGTHQDNMKDMSDKGRAVTPSVRKFTDAQVRYIRNSSKGCRVLAREFGITKSSMQAIRNNKVYKDVV